MISNTGALIGIGIYFIIMISIGYLLRNKNKSAEDFLVGGRSFGTFFNTGTLCACWIGGSIVIGIPGTVYNHGIWDTGASWGILITIGSTLCLVVAGLFYMRRLWQLKLLSLGDFYYRRFGRKAGLLATALMASTFTLWVAVQTVAFAKVGVTLVGLSLNTWIIIAIGVICTYTILGGLWAVCLTDIIQVCIVTVGIIVITPMCIEIVGGFDAVIDSIPADHLTFFPTENSINTWLAWTAGWVVLGLGNIPSPDLMQRAFSAKTANTARRSALIATVLVGFLVLMVVFLAFAGMLMVKNGQLDGALIAQDTEMLVPIMLQQIMPTPILALFLGAVLAAVMSAAATANIALSGIISKNLIKDIFVPNMSSKSLMQATRVVILCVGIFAAFVAIGMPSVFILITFGFDLILSCLFMPLTLGLFWKKANGPGALAGMAAGFIARVTLAGLVNGFTLEGIGSPTDTWYYFTLGGPIISGIAMVAVSLFTQKASPPIELEMDPIVD